MHQDVAVPAFSLKLKLRELRSVLLEAYKAFEADDGDLLAGGIAFFAVLSLAPTLVIALALASWLLGGHAVSGELVAELRPVLGDNAAAFVAEVIGHTSASGATGPAALIGVLVTLYASTRLFTQVQIALNRVWGVGPRDARSLRARAFEMVQKRLISFALVLLLGLLLALTVATKTGLSYLAGRLGLPAVPLLWRAANLTISFGALVLILSAVYRVLPEARIAWRHALRGGLITAGFLAIGALVVATYLDSVSVASAFGAAGSLVVFMLSAYYGSLIFLFGAELVGVSARRVGALRSSKPPPPP